MSFFTRLFLKLCLALALFGQLGLQAYAHFTTDSSARLIHIAKTDASEVEQGLLIYFRIPGPLAYGDFLAKRNGKASDVVPPFLQKEVIDGIPYFSLDQSNARANPDELARFLGNGYAFRVNGKEIAVQPRRAAFFSQAQHPDFVDPNGASMALDAFSSASENTSGEPIYIVDALLDVEIFIPTNQADGTLSIQSILPKIQLPPQVIINNAARDHRFEPALTKQFSGQMLEPVQFDGSWLSSLGNFTWQGIWHIFIGLDHVLFVVCLALASGISTSILWSVTGFTLGHSVTLYLGSIGVVPQGDWFVPAIELVIALSILIAALLVLLNTRASKEQSSKSGLVLFAITAAIGLLHGYGFSFVLGELLGGSTSQLTLSLIGFNLGVELGQLAIVLAIFALLWLARLLGSLWPTRLSYAGVAVAASFAIFWTFERSQILIEGNF